MKSEKSTKKIEKTDEKEANNESNEKISMTTKSIKSKTLNKRTKLDSIGDQSIEGDKILNFKNQFLINFFFFSLC